jgi:hypothetical protein
MPLVIFNYLQTEDNPTDDVLNNFKQTIELPRHALDKRWRLVAVNAVYHSNTKEDFQSFEFRIPELMSNEKVLYAVNGVNIEDPEESFRFYVKHHQITALEPPAEGREFSAHANVSEYPNLDLGLHDKTTGELNLFASAKEGKHNRKHCKLNSYSIILEYEE